MISSQNTTHANGRLTHLEETETDAPRTMSASSTPKGATTKDRSFAHVVRDKHLGSAPNKSKLSVSFQDTRLEMSELTENIFRQARSTMTLIKKSEARAQHLRDLNDKGILTPWSTGEEELPLFAEAANPDLCRQIADTRREAAQKIQTAVADALDRKAAIDNKNCGTILATLETLLEDSRESCSFNAAKGKLSLLVGKEIAALKSQLDKRARHLLETQRPTTDLVDAKLVFATPVARHRPDTDTTDRNPGGKDPRSHGQGPLRVRENNKQKGFQDPRQLRGTTAPRQDGVWQTVSTKRGRSASRENYKKPRHQATQPNVGWSLSSREKELIKAFRRQ